MGGDLIQALIKDLLPPALGVGQTPPALQVLLLKPVGENAQIDASWAL